VADGIRDRCGADFVVALKMPADEGFGASGLQLAETAEMVRRLARAGRIHLFSFGSGGPGRTFDQHVPDMTFASAPFANQLPVLKEAAGDVAIVGLGRITSRADAEALLQHKACDLVGLARPLLADAEWPKKAQRREAPRPCIYCNACWAQLPKQYPISCVINPLLGSPGEVAPSHGRSAIAGRIAVVGGGVAGLSAAGALARRGHNVFVIEAGNVLGGMARWQARLPGRGEVQKAIDHLAEEARSAGVTVLLGRQATPQLIRESGADAVVLATGAEPAAPQLKISDAHVRDLVSETSELLAGRAASGLAVLLDQSQTEATYAAAELLAERYDRLVIISPRPGFATEAALVSVPGIHRRLAAKRVEVISAAMPISLEQGILRWRSTWSGVTADLEGVSAFIYATPRAARNSLQEELHGAGVPIVAIGDARAPRSLLTAIHEGFFVPDQVEAALGAAAGTRAAAAA
jgi:hypothetical protein